MFCVWQCMYVLLFFSLSFIKEYLSTDKAEAAALLSKSVWAVCYWENVTTPQIQWGYDFGQEEFCPRQLLPWHVQCHQGLVATSLWWPSEGRPSMCGRGELHCHRSKSNSWSEKELKSLYSHLIAELTVWRLVNSYILILGRSLMIGWRKKSWNPERVPTVVTLCVCPCVRPWAAYRSHLLA